MRGVWRVRLGLWERLPTALLAARRAARGRRTLLAGWFSFGRAHATAGDLLSRELAVAWLCRAGHDVDVANLPPFGDGVDWRTVDPGAYDHVVFVCGPFHRQPNRMTSLLLKRFAGTRFVGLNVTMVEPLESWDPFTLLWERDSSRTARPDLSFLAPIDDVPVIGVCLVEPQREYAAAANDAAEASIARLTRSREMAVVQIDTRLDRPQPLRTAAEVAALFARMNAVVTTRLHGTVLALRAGVPAVVIDPIEGGEKVWRQAERLGWPARFRVEDLDDRKLADALTWCLTPDAREEAVRCRERAVDALSELERSFVERLAASRRELDERSSGGS